jgi:hypothetical protein
MADDQQTNQVLVTILEMLKRQAIYLHRQHGWITALAGAMAADPELESRLKQQPFYDQGPAPFLQTVDVMIQNIDALIQRLKG